MWNDISLWFWFAFVMLSVFSWACWPFISSLEKCLSPLSIFKLDSLLLCFWVVGVLYILWIFTLYQYMICKIFLPFCGLPLHLADSVLWCTEVFNFDVIQFIEFFFCCLCFWCHSKKSMPNPTSWRFFPMFSSKTLIVLALTFRCLIYFELIFIQC